VANLQLTGAGKQDLGLSMADSACDAYSGLNKFKEGKVNARTLMVLYPNKLQVVTVEAGGTWMDAAWVSFTAFVGIAALAGGVQNWLLRETSLIERVMLIVAGLLLVYPKPLFDFIGIGLVVAKRFYVGSRPCK
jgi:TRAP-type uncharacterized transport system fused permease subunit